MAMVFESNSLTARFLLVSAVVLFLSETEGITIRPNTRMEFASLRCRGEFDKSGYSALSRVCEDCYNLFRDKTVYNNCKSNCFHNSMFPACVRYLLLDDYMDDYSEKITVAKGDR